MSTRSYFNSFDLFLVVEDYCSFYASSFFLVKVATAVVNAEERKKDLLVLYDKR
jgi:hypothetical protein